MVGGPTFDGVDGRIPAVYHGAGAVNTDLALATAKEKLIQERISPNVGNKKWRARVRGQTLWSQGRKSAKGREVFF